MKKNLKYVPQGVCCTLMDIETEDGIIKSVKFTDACAGNTLGVAKLLQGMTMEEAIRRLEGINCKERGTSCPDQLSRALKSIKEEEGL